MSEKKYHVSRNGFLSRCSATKRGCYLGGEHYTQQQYDHLAAENDPRVRGTAVKHSPDSYYGKAEAAYVASVQRLKRFDQAQAEAKEYKEKLLKEHGLKSGDLIHSKEGTQKKLQETLDYAKEVYVEEGVNYGKASFIVQDMRNSTDPTKPITKRKDRMDSEIAQKTKNAVARLNSDPQYEKLKGEYADAQKREHTAARISQQSARHSTELIRTRNASGMPNFTEEKALQRAKTWLKAGIPPEAAEAYTSSVKPAQVSIDDKGHINNMWAETENGIERIVGYKDNNSYTGSGAFVTDKGTDVYTYTHYHSYTSTRGGINTVIVGGKNGTTHPAKEFKTNMTWDSGD